MLEYIAQVGDSFVSLAKFFFGDEVHASTLGKFNKVNDHTQEIKPSTKLRIPPKVISHAKTTHEKGKTIFHIEYGFRNCLTDSVGENGKNNYEDVMLVQKRLRELGYPGKDEVGKCGPEIIKAIKFFQAFNKTISHGLITVDGKIDKGGKSEAAMFGKNGKKYDPPKKGEPKPLETSSEKKKTDAINGTNADIKDKWQKIMDIWNEVSPFLPDGTTMASGFRIKDEQREQLYNKYFSFEKKISDKYGEGEWKKYCELCKDTTVSEADRNKNDQSMHSQICEAVSSREVALPGTSKHEKGNAIDTQSSELEKRCRSLLWYSIEFGELNHAKNITAEGNSCVHFEFI